MNDALRWSLGGAAGGLIGALLGGLLVWRRLRARLARDLPAQLSTALAPLLDARLDRMQSSVTTPAVFASAASEGETPPWVESVLQAAAAAASSAARAEQGVRDATASVVNLLGSQQAVQRTELRALQERLERWQRVVQQALAAAASVSGPAPAMSVAIPDAVDLEPLLLQVGAALDVRFDAQGQAWQALLQCIPRALQQTLQVELDFLAQQQAQRDAATSLRDEEIAAALRALIGRLGVAPTSSPAPVPAAAKALVAAPVTAERPVAPSPPAVSARPPELLLTPLPRSEPVYDEPEPMPELSDEELDALPPDLPVPDRPRRRILPAPKKPVLRKL